jgi:hypothetical protein
MEMNIYIYIRLTNKCTTQSTIIEIQWSINQLTSYRTEILILFDITNNLLPLHHSMYINNILFYFFHTSTAINLGVIFTSFTFE